MNPFAPPVPFALEVRQRLRLTTGRWFGVSFLYWSRVVVWSVS